MGGRFSFFGKKNVLRSIDLKGYIYLFKISIVWKKVSAVPCRYESLYFSGIPISPQLSLRTV